MLEAFFFTFPYKTSLSTITILKSVAIIFLKILKFGKKKLVISHYFLMNVYKYVKRSYIEQLEFIRVLETIHSLD